MNSQYERERIAAIDRNRRLDAAHEAMQPSNVFVPPKRREVATLCDWVADNPSFKQSRAYNKLLDAYWEAIGHSCL